MIVDHVAAAIDFARAAAGGAGVHGVRIRKQAARFLRDIERADADWEFVPGYARHACRWFELLPHVEGSWPTPTIDLTAWQCFALCQLFGFRRRAPLRSGSIAIDGVPQRFRPRRYTWLLYATARKNAKSTIAAGIGLYICATEPDAGQQILSAATTFNQALPIFRPAKAMVEKCQDLRTKYAFVPWSKSISMHGNGNFFKPLHAKASTQDGLNPTVALIDEVHAHKDGDLINVLQSAAGARSAPLFAFFTTEGYISTGPWREIREFADKLLAEAVEADHCLVIFFAIDDDDREDDRDCWVKANPLMLDNPLLGAAIEREFAEALTIPSKMAEFRIKRLNRQSNHADAWVNLEVWDARAGRPVELSDFVGLEVYGGLDLASNIDLAVFRIVALHPTLGLITYAWRWSAAEVVAHRSNSGMHEYAAWAEAGKIIVCDGALIDIREIKQKIIEIDAQLGLVCVAFDEWNAAQTAAELLEVGIEMRKFAQISRVYHPVMQAFERLLLGGGLNHGGDPVLRWCAGNLRVRRDAGGNMAPCKKRSSEKIDDFVALLMAYGCMLSYDGVDLSNVTADPLR